MPSVSFLRFTRKYQPLDDFASEAEAQDRQQFLGSKTEFGERHRFHDGAKSGSKTFRLLTALNVLVLFLSIAFAAHGLHLRSSLLTNKGNALLRIADWYSPVHDRTQINIIHTRVNGTLLDMDHSIFRQPPSPEVDAAWERIGSLLPHIITAQDVVRLGKDPSKVARLTEDWGYGPEAYLAELDVMHTIHCLNAIRRDVHWKHYFGDQYPDGEFPELHKIHTDHCLYIVLQDLMCHATADLITTVWVDGQLNPFPDFNINRKCRNFSDLLEWHEATAVKDMERYKAMRRPADVVPYRMSEEFHQKFDTDQGLFAPFHTHEHEHGGHGSEAGGQGNHHR
ncbi:hypothetical protein VTK26DRAFT_5928 [Humicola hyalothermophila]